jgi:hypothetical protein
MTKQEMGACPRSTPTESMAASPRWMAIAAGHHVAALGKELMSGYGINTPNGP